MNFERATRRAERLLVPAAFVTALGNNVQLIAGALLMIRSDRTMLAVGLLFVAVAAPQAALSPLFGRVADRHDRRRLWIGCDVTSAVLALALPVWLALGGAKGPGVYAANFALAVVAALFFPVSNALIKERVRPAQVRRFNANYEMATQGGMLLSATVGGLLVQRLGAEPLLVFNAGTFVVSAGLVAAVGRRPGDGVEIGGVEAVGAVVSGVGAMVVGAGGLGAVGMAAGAEVSGEGAVAAGAVTSGAAVSAGAVTGAGGSAGAVTSGAVASVGAASSGGAGHSGGAALSGPPIASRIPLARLVLLYAQGSVVVTVFNALLPKLVMGEWGRGAALFGIVDAIGSLGFLAATAVYKAAGRRFGDLPIAVFGFLLCNVALVLQPLFGPVALGLGVGVGAFTYGTARIASRSLVLTSVDEAHVGRAFGLANGAGLAVTVAVMLGVAELVDHTDSRWGFAVTAGLSALAAAAAGVLLRGPLSQSRAAARQRGDRSGIPSRMVGHDRRRRAARAVLPDAAPAPDCGGLPDAGLAG